MKSKGKRVLFEYGFLETRTVARCGWSEVVESWRERMTGGERWVKDDDGW